MSAKEAFLKFKHLDGILSDPEFQPEKKDCDGCRLGRTLAQICRELWAAIKEDAK